MTLANRDSMRLHHMGFVVRSIDNEIDNFLKSFAATWDGRVFNDPIQKVKIAFLRSSAAADAQLELVEPADENSPVLQFLQKGGGLHHLCYEVPDLEQHLKEMRSHHAVIVKKPQPAVAFDGRRIAWVMTAQKVLLEFLEYSRSD
jgi:methylmalonyl-CoA/ethylmalonyl-CoA epimerase